MFISNILLAKVFTTLFTENELILQCCSNGIGDIPHEAKVNLLIVGKAEVGRCACLPFSAPRRVVVKLAKLAKLGKVSSGQTTFRKVIKLFLRPGFLTICSKN